jgi:hypothetical protein
MNANRHPILRWLAVQLASNLEVAATTIDPMVPLAEMGVDSVHAVSLVGLSRCTSTSTSTRR